MITKHSRCGVSIWFPNGGSYQTWRTQIARLHQPSATHPIFGTNLNFRHLPKNFNLNSWLTVLMNCLKCPHGLDNVVIILMKSTGAWATLSSFWCNLHGLGQHYHLFDAIFLFFRKLDKVSDHVTWSQRLSSCLNNKKIASKGDNVAQAFESYCSENSTKFQTTLRGPAIVEFSEQ